MHRVLMAMSLLVRVCLTSVVQAQSDVPKDRIAGGCHRTCPRHQIAIHQLHRPVCSGNSAGGEVQLPLGVVVSLRVVFFLGTAATRWLQHGLRETVLPRTRLDPGARNALVR